MTDQSIASKNPPTHSQEPVALMPTLQLLKDAWGISLSKIGALFKLSLVYIGAMIAVVLILGMVSVLTVFPLFASVKTNPDMLLPAILASLIVGLSALVLVIVIQSVQTIAHISIIADAKYQGLKFYLVAAFPSIIPLSLAGTYVGLLQFGGLMLFVAPALLMALMFVFVSFVVVCEKKGAMEGVRRSFDLVSGHFGDVLSRILVLWLIQIGISYVVPSLFEGGRGMGKAGGGILYFVLNYGVGVFASVYMYLLYRDLVRIFDSTRTIRRFWPLPVAVVGWIIFIISTVSIWQLIAHNKDEIQHTIQKTIQEIQQKESKERTPPFIPDAIKFKPPLNTPQSEQI